VSATLRMNGTEQSIYLEALSRFFFKYFLVTRLSNMQSLRTQDKKSRRRQDPVSCALCRKKKWKCNRERPCSNCATRGVVCEGQKDVVFSSKYNKPLVDNDAILARLQKLEDIVTGLSGASTKTTTPIPLGEPSGSLFPINQLEDQCQTDSRHIEAMSDFVSSSVRPRIHIS
jgi:Fungal Zn(2)-Cys(6) binuclear cluster domain